MTLGRTFHLIGTDFRKAIQEYHRRPSMMSVISVAFTPSVIATVIYRLSHYCWSTGILKPVARLLHLVNLSWTGAEILWDAQIGERFFLGPITIGDHAIIAATAFVTVSVPPCGFAVGNPARVSMRRSREVDPPPS